MALSEAEKKQLEDLKRENQRLRKNQKPVEAKPVVALAWRQPLNEAQKASLVKSLKSDLLKVFDLNKPKNKLARLAEFKTSVEVAIANSVKWLNKGTGHEWTIKSFTPQFRFDKENDFDKSYIEIEWTAMGFVKPDGMYKTAEQSPTPSPEPIVVFTQIERSEVG